MRPRASQVARIRFVETEDGHTYQQECVIFVEVKQTKLRSDNQVWKVVQMVVQMVV